VNTIKSTEAVLEVSKAVGLDVGGRSHKTAGQNQNFTTAYKANFKNLGTTVTDQNCIHDKIKCRLNFGNDLLSFCSELFSLRSAEKNPKIKIHITIIFYPLSLLRV